MKAIITLEFVELKDDKNTAHPDRSFESNGVCLAPPSPSPSPPSLNYRRNIVTINASNHITPSGLPPSLTMF